MTTNRLAPVAGVSAIAVIAFVMVFVTLGLRQPPGGNAATLPAGVTLRPIDGGADYYCRNGFTYACSTTFNGMNWDDPRFFPIGQDYSFYDQHSTATYKDLGLNYVHRVTAPTNMSLLRNAGIWAILSPGEGINPGAETVGWHIEEPDSYDAIKSGVQSIGAGLAGRFIQMSSTWNQLHYGDYSGIPMDEVYSNPISTSVGNVHLNIPGDDEYWFAAAPTGFGQYVGGQMYKDGVNMTADEMARGDHYGDMVDTMRSWLTTYPAPVGAPYIETSDGLLGETDRSRITPPQLNWAVWSTLVHGARWIMYFSTTTNFNDQAVFDFSQAVLPGQTVSMYNQAKSLHALVKNVAPILNSPFALNYATVTPAGYVFPTPKMSLTNGIDIMAKYYTGGTLTNSAGTLKNGFYIFSSVRGSQTQTNIPATFTVAGGYTGPVTVVNENRTVQATNGRFTDTFATAYTAHIYQIPDGSATTPTPTATGSPAPGKLGDVNSDGQVNVFDLSILLSHWATNFASTDLNHDGTVNVFDLSLLLSHWGT